LAVLYIILIMIQECRNKASKVEAGGTKYIPLPGARKKKLWQYFGFKSEDGETIAPGSEKKVYCLVCRNLPFYF